MSRLDEARHRQRSQRARPSTNGHAAEDAPPARLATTCLTGIKPEPVRWLVPGLIPLGKLLLFAGDGGDGKSTLTLGLAADVSQGFACFGLDYVPLPQAEVLLISCEDDYGDTVVPRLLAAGADMSRVFRVDGVQGPNKKTIPFNLLCYQQLERELTLRPNVRLVVIDPAGAYVGSTGTDDHNDSELRSLLGPLAELAARCRVTIILIKHLVKGVTAKAVHKVSGSAGYVNTVRAAFVVAPDPEDDTRKLFLPLKFNLGPKPRGLAYRLEALPEADQERIVSSFAHLEDADRERLAKQLFGVAWLGPVDIDADTAMADQAKRERGPSKTDEAAEWLERFLSEFAYPSDEVLEAGKQAGFTRNNLFNAKKQLGIKASNRGRFSGPWHWGTGDPQNWSLRPPHQNTSDTPDTMDSTDAHSVQSVHSGESVLGEPPFETEVGNHR